MVVSLIGLWGHLSFKLQTFKQALMASVGCGDCRHTDVLAACCGCLFLSLIAFSYFYDNGLWSKHSGTSKQATVVLKDTGNQRNNMS